MFVRTFASVGLLVSLFAATATSDSVSRRHVEVMNDSGRHVVVHWVHPSTGEFVRFSQPVLHNGESMAFDSFVNHSFVFQEANNETACRIRGDKNCPASQLIVGEHDEQVVFIRDGLRLEYHDAVVEARSEAAEALEPCKSQAYEELSHGQNPNQVLQHLMTCMEEEAAEAFQRKNDEKAFEERLRLELADELEPYTCQGHQNTTSPIAVREWVHEGVMRQVGVLHQRKASQIHVLKDFISPEECEAIRIAAEPSLHRGTVADGNGGSELSSHRKAWQAGVVMPFEDEENLIGRVGRRMYAYANHATGYNLTYDGQEDLMSIQYFGRGHDDDAPDQYKPHCDCDCGGLPHKSGGRVATMVMYCNVPSVGGGTNFQNSGVYIKPELGAAAFFSYMDPETQVMENGFTTHSGCPVILGTKRIAVHWMRVGVDAASPWDSFDTRNIKKSILEETC